MAKLDAVIKYLRHEEDLPDRYCDHEFVGNEKGHRECHIEPDWLLKYRINKGEMVLEAISTGTHQEVFK